MSDSSTSNAPILDRKIFSFSFGATCFIIICLSVFPEITSSIATQTMGFLTHKLGWFFLLTGVIPLIICIWLAFGRYADVKFGDPDDKPEYSNASWAAMMFATSMGASLIAWGFAEPIFYLDTPPFGIEPNSTLSVEWAHMYPLYHWSFIPWGMYCLPGVPIALMLFRRKQKNLRISDACEACLPENNKTALKTFIDIFVVIGIVGGVATSIGFGVPLVSSLLVKWLGVPDTLYTKFGVIIMYTLIFGYSAYKGLNKGIKLLSDINLGIMVTFMLFVLIAGPTVYILNITVNSMGLMIDNIIRMSFWTDPAARSGFPESWTMFYWAWWFAYTPMMGLFFGRISKGRTIRQYIFGVLGFGCLGSISFLAIAGGYSLHLETFEILPAREILNDPSISSESRVGALVANVLSQLPLSSIVLAVAIILAVIFYATTFDSAAYVLASITTKNLQNNQEPARWNRLLWAFALGAVAAGLMIAGSFDTIKAMTVILSLPVIIILFMMIYTMINWLKKESI